MMNSGKYIVCVIAPNISIERVRNMATKQKKQQKKHQKKDTSIQDLKKIASLLWKHKVTSVAIISFLISVVFAVGVFYNDVQHLKGDVSTLRDDFTAMDTAVDDIIPSISKELTQVKNSLEDKITEQNNTISQLSADLAAAKSQLNTVQELLIEPLFGSLQPSQSFKEAINRTYTEVDRIVDIAPEAVPLSATVAYLPDIDYSYTAEQLADQPLLISYINNGQEVFFYGQLNETGAWDGHCIVNIYENGKLSLITDAIYDGNQLLTYKQAFPGETTGGQPIWVISNREAKDGFSIGENWHYFRSSNYAQSFSFDNVTVEDILSVETFTAEVSSALEGYYSGNMSGGAYNDDTGNAYMVKYFDDGSVKTLYVGYFVDGAFHDASGYSWMIGKIEQSDEYYSYYTGPFSNGNQAKEKQYWEYDLTESRIEEILGDRTFAVSLTGLIESL